MSGSGAKVVKRCIFYLTVPIASFSLQYFYVYPQLNLLCVPLSESDFLLHLPDLYHELAHPLTSERYNPRTKPFQESLSQSLDAALKYITSELIKESRRRGPELFEFYLRQWLKSWTNWAIEFFCDLFAVYTIGPAFGWSHLHLCAKRGDDPFYVPTFKATSHPADDARMRVMLHGLRITGFSKEADSIREHWERLLLISGANPEPETNLPVYTLLNQAWPEFWHNPKGYTGWEAGAVKRLYEQIL